MGPGYPQGAVGDEHGHTIERWGRDHWSVLLYAETECVNSWHGIGRPDRRKLYCDVNRHPGLWDSLGNPRRETHPIRLVGDELLEDYDEWDCLDDLEEAGLLLIQGTGINVMLRMTDLGSKWAARVRKHKAQGGSFATFRI